MSLCLWVCFCPIDKVTYVIFVVVQLLSHVWLPATPWTVGHQASLSFTISQSLPKLMFFKLVMPSHHAILCHPLLLLPSIFPSLRVSKLFTSGDQNVGASASILPMNIWSWFPVGLTGLITLLSKRLSKVFSSTKFESINYLVLRFLYGPILTSIHDYLKNDSFDCMYLVGKVISVFSYAVYVCQSFSSKEQTSFNFMAAVTICSDSGVQENKVCHCFPIFPIYLPCSNEPEFHDLRFLNVEF